MNITLLLTYQIFNESITGFTRTCPDVRGFIHTTLFRKEFKTLYTLTRNDILTVGREIYHAKEKPFVLASES